MKLHYITMKYSQPVKEIPPLHIGHKEKSRLSLWLLKIKDKFAFKFTWRF